MHIYEHVYRNLYVEIQTRNKPNSELTRIFIN